MVLPLSAPAPAQVRNTGDYLRLMDANHDGQVQLSEYQDWLCYGFDRMDHNHDGVLTPDEQPGGRGKGITREQYRAQLAGQFRKLDRNHDGVLDVKELASPPR
ncbi:MAG: EF-hand domain-containing protein [Proteobacteria bacterium]|nr:EF-hand domain-containing protein [Pseudomonadota bacterium]